MSDPWTACRLPDCRALHLRISVEPASTEVSKCAAHKVPRTFSSWFFVKRATESCCKAHNTLLRTLPMAPEQRLVLDEQSGVARCGDGCVLQVLSLELAPLADKKKTVYMAHDHESEQRERVAARREAQERNVCL